MANSGYIINPSLIQVFGSGPSSGSLVSSSSLVEFNPTSSFTSSLICGDEYNYRIYDPINCPPSGSCVSPTITYASPVFCNNQYNYEYELHYNVNGNIGDIPSTIIEYSNNLSFTSSSVVSVNSQSFNNTSSIMEIIVDVSDMNNLPINSNSGIYFRAYNSCSLYGLSDYSQKKGECVEDETAILVILSQNSTINTQCDPELIGIAYEDTGFIGNVYYINTNNFSTATSLYINNSPPLNNANPNWYSNGIIARYWNGITFTQTTNCP